MVEFHALEFLGVLACAADDSYFSSSFVDRAEVAVKADGEEIPRVVGGQGEELAVEIGHETRFGGFQINCEKCRAGVVDSRYGIHLCGRPVVGHVIDKISVAGELAESFIGSRFEVYTHELFGDLNAAYHLRRCHIIGVVAVGAGGRRFIIAYCASESRFRVAFEVERDNVVCHRRLPGAESKNAVCGIVYGRPGISSENNRCQK